MSQAVVDSDYLSSKLSEIATAQGSSERERNARARKNGGYSVYVLPISGGYFVNQLGFLMELATLHRPLSCVNAPTFDPLVPDLSCTRESAPVRIERGIIPSPVIQREDFAAREVTEARVLRTCASRDLVIPDIVMGGSGGNVAAYIAACAGWTEEGMRRVARELEPKIFAQRHYSLLPHSLSALISALVFKRAMFKQAERERCVAFFESFLNPEICKKVEIWTGTVNRTLRRAQMFCNRSEREALLRGRVATESLLGCLPPIYTDGDVSKIAKAALASASIPTIVPAVEIDGEEYNDCGCAFADPLIPMQDRLDSLAGDGPLHITLISGYDTERNDASRRVSSLYEEGMDALSSIQTSMALQSRLCALEFVRSGQGGALMFREGVCDAVVLRDLHAQRTNGDMRRSLLEMYPSVDNHVEITNFTPVDIEKAVERARRNYRYRIWWRE